MDRRDLLKLSLLGAAAAPFANASAFAADSKVAISEAIRLAMYASLYVAADKGLFAKYGLDAISTRASPAWSRTRN